MDEGPPPSQASDPNGLKIFVHEDGSGIEIFVQADGMARRPKLVRELRNLGASICFDLNNAQIIIVDQRTPEGRNFVRDWGDAQGKSILHYVWVRKSVEAGKALLSDDNWGGCSARDDGDNMSDTELSKSPLPTPRVTPVETNGSRSLGSGMYATPGEQSDRENSSMPRPAPPNSSTSDGPITPVDAGSQATPNFASAPLGMQSFLQQYPVQMMNPQMFQMAMMMSQPNSEAFQIAFQDIMTRANLGSVQPNVFNPPGQHATVQEQILPFPDIPSKSNSKKRRSSPISPLIRDRSMSISSESLSRQASMDRKGKMRASSPSSKRRKTASFHGVGTESNKSSGSGAGSSQEKLFTSKSGRQLSFFVQIDLHNRFSVVDAIKKNGGRIEKDAENADYAVLYSGHKRQKTFNDLLLSAQMAGRPAVPSRYIYECVEEGVLLETSSYEFDSGLKKRKRVVKTERASSDEEVDIEAEKKRLEFNARRNERRRELNLEKEAEAAAASRRKVPTPKTNGTPNSKAKDSTTSALPLGRPSPTPPGQQKHEMTGTGFKFSEAEREFALKYGEILVERDHTMSTTAICKEIYKKLPHHPHRSWVTYFSRISQGQLDDWRKRSSIAYRKALRQSQQGPPSQPFIAETEAQESAVLELSSSPPVILENETTTFDEIETHLDEPTRILQLEDKSFVNEDVDVVAQFFAGLNDTGEESEDALWARLTAMKPCRSWSNWAEFYQVHYDEVQTRYAELGGST